MRDAYCRRAKTVVLTFRDEPPAFVHEEVGPGHAQVCTLPRKTCRLPEIMDDVKHPSTDGHLVAFGNAAVAT